MREILTDHARQPFALSLTYDGYNPKNIYLGNIKVCQVDIKWPVDYVADYWIVLPGNRDPIFGGHNWDQCGPKIIELLQKTELRLLWPIKGEEETVFNVAISDLKKAPQIGTYETDEHSRLPGERKRPIK